MNGYKTYRYEVYFRDWAGCLLDIIHKDYSTNACNQFRTVT